jgi:hypothetical protein
MRRLVRPAPLPGVPMSAFPWQGEISPKPWEYDVTVVIPNLNGMETAKVAIDLWRLQSVRPYLMVIDTGSECQEVYDWFKERTDDLEVHVVRSNAYCCASEPVTAAMDLAFSLCQSRYLLATHTDVFPRARDLIKSFLAIAKSGFDVVGYQMSPRRDGYWQHCPSHTCSLYYLPLMRRLRAQWSMQGYRDTIGLDWNPLVNPCGGWPDTESTIGYLINRKKVRWYCIGPETNGERFTDHWIDHVRSFASSKMYSPEYHLLAQSWMSDALDDARRRALRWSREDEQGGKHPDTVQGPEGSHL